MATGRSGAPQTVAADGLAGRGGVECTGAGLGGVVTRLGDATGGDICGDEMLGGVYAGTEIGVTRGAAGGVGRSG